MKQRLTTYEELELISETECRDQGKQTPLQKWLKTAWEFLLKHLTKGSELQVWQVRGWDGSTYWQVHNPMTGQSATLGSEAEVIDWIEQSYYQREHPS